MSQGWMSLGGQLLHHLDRLTQAVLTSRTRCFSGRRSGHAPRALDDMMPCWARFWGQSVQGAATKTASPERGRVEKKSSTLAASVQQTFGQATAGNKGGHVVQGYRPDTGQSWRQSGPLEILDRGAGQRPAGTWLGATSKGSRINLFHIQHLQSNNTARSLG